MYKRQFDDGAAAAGGGRAAAAGGGSGGSGGAPLSPGVVAVTSPIGAASPSRATVGAVFGAGLCAVPQQYETPLHPCGCIFKCVIHSSHGDPFYVGLNGLELADVDGRVLPLDGSNVEAIPRDINELPDTRGDPRTLDKL